MTSQSRSRAVRTKKSTSRSRDSTKVEVETDFVIPCAEKLPNDPLDRPRMFTNSPNLPGGPPDFWDMGCRDFSASAWTLKMRLPANIFRTERSAKFFVPAIPLKLLKSGYPTLSEIKL